MLRVRTTLTGVAGSPWYSNMYFVGSSSVGAAQAVAAVGNFWNGVDQLIHTGVTFTVDGLVVQFDEATGAPVGVFQTDSITGTGDEPGDPLPRANQGLVQWRTGEYNGSREIRGRTFVPGITETSTSGGLFAAASKAVVQSSADALVAAGTADQELAVWSRPNPDLVPPRVGNAAPVVSATVWDQFAVLRSRRD